MLGLTFIYAAACIGVGVGAVLLAGEHDTAPIALSAFFFGGATLICGFFGLQNRIHGLSGAAFLSFLASLTGFGALVSQAREGQFGLASHSTKLLLAHASIAALYLLGAVLHYRRSREERMRTELDAPPRESRHAPGRRD